MAPGLVSPKGIFNSVQQKQLDYCLMMPIRKVLAQPRDASIDYLFLESQLPDSATLFAKNVFTFAHRLLFGPSTPAKSSLESFRDTHIHGQHIPHSSVKLAWPHLIPSSLQQTGFLFNRYLPLPYKKFKASVLLQCLHRRLSSVIQRSMSAPFLDPMVSFRQHHPSYPSLCPSFMFCDPPPVVTIKSALRLGTSRLRATLHRKNKADTPACQYCLNRPLNPRVVLDDLNHRLWDCDHFAGPRAAFLQSVQFPPRIDRRQLLLNCAIDNPTTDFSSLSPSFRQNFNRFLLALQQIDPIHWKYN